jgi:hypothetical protein
VPLNIQSALVARLYYINCTSCIRAGLLKQIGAKTKCPQILRYMPCDVITAPYSLED